MVFLIIWIITLLIYLRYIIVSWATIYAHNSKEIVRKRFDEKARALSIIIPFRNEALALPSLESDLRTILKLEQNIEVIWVNDHSEDGVLPDLKGYNGKLLRLDKNSFGKKSALKLGIDHSTHNHILTLDSDVRLSAQFINVLRSSWREEALFIFPVVLESTTVMGRILMVESIGLLGLTVGSALREKALMCNGAALGIDKEIYNQLSIPHSDMASGDDMFLLEAMKKNKESIGTTLNPNGLVRTDAPETFKKLVQQRIRWAGKSSVTKDLELKTLGVAVLGLYLGLLILLITASYRIQIITILCYSLKLILETAFIQFTAKKLTIGTRFWAFILIGIVYPFYSLYIGLLSMYRRPKWKGREI